MPAVVYTAKVVGTMSIGIWAGYNASLINSLTSEASWKSAGCKACQGLQKLQHLLYSVINKEIPKRKCHGEADDLEAQKPKEQNQAISVRRVLEYSLSAIRASAMSGVALVANLAAYSFASRSGKHPYLIYLALGAPLVGVLQYYGARELRSQSSGSKAIPKDHDPLDEESYGEASGLGASTYEKIASPKQGSSTHPSASTACNVSAADSSDLSLKHKYSVHSIVVAGLSTFLFSISVIGLAGESHAF